MQTKLVLALLTVFTSTTVLASPQICTTKVDDCKQQCLSPGYGYSCTYQQCLDYCQCQYCSLLGPGHHCTAECAPTGF
ncbi:hypothetical protein L218DRAFT_966566 [Marasmius fiardii PR-910]|nr:hypothetical protein L218DRAFT_966566 [Marasmius fiardii PR-910]